MRSPSMQAQEISIMTQLDGPRTLLLRDPIGQRTHEVTGSAKWECSQRDTFIPRTTTNRGREYRGEYSDNDGSRRPHRNQRPPEEGRYPNQGGRHPN